MNQGGIMGGERRRGDTMRDTNQGGTVAGTTRLGEVRRFRAPMARTVRRIKVSRWQARRSQTVRCELGLAVRCADTGAGPPSYASKREPKNDMSVGNSIELLTSLWDEDSPNMTTRAAPVTENVSIILANAVPLLQAQHVVRHHSVYRRYMWPDNVSWSDAYQQCVVASNPLHLEARKIVLHVAPFLNHSTHAILEKGSTYRAMNRSCSGTESKPWFCVKAKNHMTRKRVNVISLIAHVPRYGDNILQTAKSLQTICDWPHQKSTLQGLKNLNQQRFMPCIFFSSSERGPASKYLYQLSDSFLQAWSTLHSWRARKAAKSKKVIARWLRYQGGLFYILLENCANGNITSKTCSLNFAKEDDVAPEKTCRRVNSWDCGASTFGCATSHQCRASTIFSRQHYPSSIRFFGSSFTLARKLCFSAKTFPADILWPNLLLVLSVVCTFHYKG